MTSERWRRIEQLYLLAAGLRGADRAAALAEASPEVRRDVEEMLAQPTGLNLLNAPAWTDAPLDLKSILAVAFEKVPDERDAYLDQVCGGTELRRRVESLIAACEQTAKLRRDEH